MASRDFITRASDERMLEVLHLSEGGMGCTTIGRRLGLTKNAVVGIVNRIRHEPDRCECVRAENKSGGMPVKWWAA